MERISVARSSESGDSDSAPVSIVHVSLANTSAAVQSFIQAHPGILQAAHGGGTIQTIQVKVGADGETITLAEDDEHRGRREMLTRRPSYRKILSDLSSGPNNLTIPKIEEEENSEDQTSQDSIDENSVSSDNPTTQQYVPIQITTDGVGGLQTLTMTNVNSPPPASVQSVVSGPTVLQYAAAQGADGGQFFIPVSTLSAGNIQYQLSGSSLGGGVVMATSGGSSPGAVPEEASRKRELRLLKNREAARECRRKKKDYIKCLENRVALLENQNKTLIEELKSLKELYCQKDGQ